MQETMQEESEKVGLKLNIQKTKIILGGSKITADGDCSHEIKFSLEEKLWVI